MILAIAIAAGCLWAAWKLQGHVMCRRGHRFDRWYVCKRCGETKSFLVSMSTWDDSKPDIIKMLQDVREYMEADIGAPYNDYPPLIQPPNQPFKDKVNW